MSHTADHRSEPPPTYWSGKPEEHSRKIAYSVREILNGKTNNHFTVNLDAGTDCTEINFPPARPGVSVSIAAMNQAAAAFQRVNDIWGEADFRKVKICHDATAVGTEIFAVVIVG